MMPPRRPPPPFSPVLLAGLALAPLPPRLLRPALALALAAVRRRHGQVFERLAGVGRPTFLIEPTDLPLAFVLVADPEAPSLAAVAAGAEVAATATIRGPLATLVELLEGRLDGDAAFFARELVIEGSTEAVVALRNAVDGAEIDLVQDLLALLGPLAGPASAAVGLARAAYGRLAQDLATLQAALAGPAERRAEAQAARLGRLEARLAELGANARRPKAQP